MVATAAALGRHASAIRSRAAVCLRAGTRPSWSFFPNVIPPFSSCRLGDFVSTRSARRSAFWSPRSQPQHWTGRVTPIAAKIQIAASIHCCADLRCLRSDPQLARAATVRLSRRFCSARADLDQWQFPAPATQQSHSRGQKPSAPAVQAGALPKEGDGSSHMRR